MSALYARTGAEAHLYMSSRPCECGQRGLDAEAAVFAEGDKLLSRYTGRCLRCGTLRTFVFEIPAKMRPIGSRLDFGGEEPSRLLDAGEWLTLADHHAKLPSPARRDLEIACAAVEEVLKFIPPGAEQVPAEAFRTEQGRAVRDAEPGRFRRARLEAVRDAYRDLLANDGSRSSGPSATSSAAPTDKPLEEYPLELLIETFAHAVVKQQGLEGEALRRYTAELQGQMRSLVKRLQLQLAEERQRAQTSTEIEQLLDGIAQTGTAAGRIIAEHRSAIAQAFHGIDLARMSDGIGVLSAWLSTPGGDRDKVIQELLDKLYAVMGSAAADARHCNEQE